MEMRTAFAKPKPLLLCLERLADGSLERFVRCTAKPGRERGLAIGLDGSILWCDSGPVGCEIWVAKDQRLVAFCPEEAPPTVLTRAGRALELPRGKPVIVRNQDELQLAGARFRVHIHGLATEIHAPQTLRALPRFAAAAAVAMAMGSSAAGCSLSAENGLKDGQPSYTAYPGADSPGGDGAIDAGGNQPPIFPPASVFRPPDSGAGLDGTGDDAEVEIRNSPPM